ncbi:MAG: TPM domain-containing protein [Nitrospirae bacterium]|nr:TPM domain-containing protein [Nitrospirota bacterium]
MKKSTAFFTEDEKNKIEKTVHAVECCTIGEVAVMIVDSSDEYREATMLGGIFLSALAAFALAEMLFDASITFFIPLCILLFFPFKMLFTLIPKLKISFIGRIRKEEAVRQRAVRAFFEKGLYKTKANTGVLFFLSLLERKVWVLADKGIYEKIDQETLNGFAQTVSQGVKDNRAGEALCTAIKGAGDLLAKHFPIVHGDTDELSNKIMTE